VNDVILDQCLADLRAQRATIADCLARYPDLADELKPLLETAMALEATPAVQPSAAFKQATRARLLRLQPPAHTGARQRTRWLALGGNLQYAATALILVLLCLALTGGVTYAASTSLPGSTLYPVKRAVEQIELALATTPDSQARVHMALADQRLKEAIALSQRGQEQMAEQALMEYSAQVNAAIAVLPAQSNRGIVESLARQQEELRTIHVPASAKQAVEDALGASRKAIEHFSLQPSTAPPGPPATKPKPANAPALPPIATPAAIESPRRPDLEHEKQTPRAPELPLSPAPIIPVPAPSLQPTVTLTIPVPPDFKSTLPGGENRRGDGK
jgi:hypothetical protein